MRKSKSSVSIIGNSPKANVTGEKAGAKADDAVDKMGIIVKQMRFHGPILPENNFRRQAVLMTDDLTFPGHFCTEASGADKRYILCRKYLHCHTCSAYLSKQMDRSLTDLTGRKFGKWVVLPRGHLEPNHLHCEWLVQCECGRLRLVAGEELLSGRSSSCGCAPRRKNGNNGKTSGHGVALRTRLQRVMNALPPEGTGSRVKSEGARESDLIHEDTESDFWFD